MAELPLPYVPIDPRIMESQRFQDFVDAADVDEDQALLHIMKLLLFAGRMRPDGDLSTMSARQLARTCGWRDEPGAFVEALVKSGWLEEHGPGYRIEGWERHGGRSMDERERGRKRKAEWRASKACPEDNDDVSPVHDDDVPGTSPGHGGTERDTDGTSS